MSYNDCEAEVLAILKGIPALQDTYAADTLSFDSLTATVADSGNGLAWLEVGDKVTISGSVSNDGIVTVVSVLAGAVVVEEPLTDEVEGASVTLVRKDRVVRGTYSVLDWGLPQCAVLEPGAFVDEASEWTLTDPSPIRAWLWDTILNIFIRYTPDEAAVTATFRTLRDLIIAQLVQYPNLDGSTLRIQVTSIASEGDPVDVAMLGSTSGPSYKLQTLRIKVREIDSHTVGNA